MGTERLNKLLKLVEADPSDTFCLYALAQEFAREGDFPKALDYYDRTIAADPDYFYAYYHKAVALTSCQRPGEARATVEAGLRRPAIANDPKALNELQEYLESLPPASSPPSTGSWAP